MSKGKQYACKVCEWQGTLEPTDEVGDANCPECRSLVFPLSWGETWGFVLLVVGGMTAAIVTICWLVSKR